MWHRARWPDRTKSRYVIREQLQPDGWDAWVVTPPTSDPPPPDYAEIDALNFMGRLGWELVHIETIVEMPPDVDDKRYAHHRHQYFFKRPVAEG
jgi:hypothetical protein